MLTLFIRLVTYSSRASPAALTVPYAFTVVLENFSFRLSLSMLWVPPSRVLSQIAKKVVKILLCIGPFFAFSCSFETHWV